MESFVLYHSHVMTLALLSGEDCQKALIALDRYAATGELPPVYDKVALAVESILPTMKKSMNRYNAAKANGNLGGRGRKKQGPKPELKPEPKPDTEPEVKPEPEPEHESGPEPESAPEQEKKPELKPEPEPELKPELNQTGNLNPNLNSYSYSSSSLNLNSNKNLNLDSPEGVFLENPKNAEEALKTADSPKNGKTPADPSAGSMAAPSRSNTGILEPDVTALFQGAREIWNSENLAPECRDLVIPPSKYGCLRTFQNYDPGDIENAIKNFAWHVHGRCGPGYKPPPPYGSIYGFLENGVPRYFADDKIDQQFKEPDRGP
jgi:hypothetical protein